MGNNTSSLPLRKSSFSKDHSKAHHIEYASASTSKASPVKMKRRHSSSSSKNSDSSPSKGTAPSVKNPTIPANQYGMKGDPVDSNRPRVPTPNLFLDNLVDTDYFGIGKDGGTNEKLGSSSKLNSSSGDTSTEVNNEVTNIITGTELFDDEDGYGIDEDLVSAGTTNEEFKKQVLIKYFNHNNNLKDTDSVFVVGSFNHWLEKIPLSPEISKSSNKVSYFKVLINLPYGVYRVKFIVNNEIKYSDNLPIATDKLGNVVNWFEVEGLPDEIYEAGSNETYKIFNNKMKTSTSFLRQSDSSFEHSRSVTPQPASSASHSTQNQSQISQNVPERLIYTNEIPKMCQNTITNDNSDDGDFLPTDEDFLHKHPIPELPVYLNNSYLNKHFSRHHYDNNPENDNVTATRTQVNGLNSHIMPHVNLNHLLTANIKNNTLSVACTTRYVGKFVTQIMYSPSEYDF